jgi:phosphoribosylformylglycinamidine synthase
MELNSKSREEAEKDIEEMCGKLLANPVIEDYRYEIEKDSG